MNNGEIGYCACKQSCTEKEGDCDFDYQCQFGLKCGSNNCPASLGFDSEFDCCFQGCKSHRILSNNLISEFLIYYVVCL